MIIKLKMCAYRIVSETEGVTYFDNYASAVAFMRSNRSRFGRERLESSETGATIIEKRYVRELNGFFFFFLKETFVLIDEEEEILYESCNKK